MSNFDRLQKIVMQQQEIILGNPEKANLHKFNLFKSLVKFLISITKNKDKNKLVFNFDTGEPYYKKSQYNLNTRNRFKVSLAQIKPDLGLSFNEMNLVQRLCIMFILQVLLSNNMYYKFLMIMLQQNVLGELADIRYWAKDKDEIAKIIEAYNPNKNIINKKVLDVNDKDVITKHAFSRSQGAYWSYIFIVKDLSKIGFGFSGHHINLNYNFYVKGNKVEIEFMPFFIGSAPVIIPSYLKKDIKKITCKKYGRTQGFWYAMSGMNISTLWYYFNALINSIYNNKKYRFSLHKTNKQIRKLESVKIGGHTAFGQSKLDGFIDTCDSKCFNKNISSLKFNNMNIKSKNILTAIVNYLQNSISFKNDNNFTINNIVKDMKTFKFSWSGNLIQSKKSNKDPILYIRLMGSIYTIEYLISNEFTIAPSTTKSLYTHDHCIVRYTDSHFPYIRAFDNKKPYYLDKKYTKNIKKSNKKNKTKKK